MNEPPNNGAPKVRCAIYTRKSTSEGLDSDFNTLDAQREAAQYFIRAMAGEGWEALPHRYDDGGFTGANTDRPALERLLADIEAGEVDCMVVYKVDRLSRSLMDFAKLLALFDQKDVTFVSTTQNFNTTNSMGRLTLHILPSFAQFEREMIAERTRDKMAAARKRGKWLGSRPPYGYLGDHDKKQLVVCEEEAERVRTIFRMYVRLGSVNAVAKRINDLGWMKKGYRAKTGRVTPPRKYRDKDVHTILRNVTYLGKVEFNGELYEGEHEAIVSEELFARVQSVLSSKACGHGTRTVSSPTPTTTTRLRGARARQAARTQSRVPAPGHRLVRALRQAHHHRRGPRAEQGGLPLLRVLEPRAEGTRRLRPPAPRRRGARAAGGQPGEGPLHRPAAARRDRRPHGGRPSRGHGGDHLGARAHRCRRGEASR